jgi:hypothetical protein
MRLSLNEVHNVHSCLLSAVTTLPTIPEATRSSFISLTQVKPG